MDNKGISNYLLMLLVLLLVHAHRVDSERMLDISDFIVEFTSMNGEPKHSRQKRDASTMLLEYIVVVEVNVSQVVWLEQIRSSLNSISFPLQLDNTTEIDDLNITTVCQPNGMNYQCTCEDQFVWSYNDCVAYEACSNISTRPCGCISAIPSDGPMCVPESEMPFIDFMVELEISTSSSPVTDEVRKILGEFSFPIPLDSVTEVTNMDITTVCILNNTGYQCRCEDQYFWPCNTCMTYEPCDNITNFTCGCISGFPKDGIFCQPLTELTTPTEYMLEIEIDTVDAAVLNELRNILKTVSLSLEISDIQIIDLNITTG
ncbi:uncharacterized protein [Hoplias malabaricus]|uniref:uncharacterized protein n=1 Tax=Hoplias malabaricus TaxID=27720 RepID=UPI00346376B2